MCGCMPFCAATACPETSISNQVGVEIPCLSIKPTAPVPPIHNGCRGNTAGLAKMVVGRKADDVKELLRGIPCRGATSCPDQLARAIDAYEQQEAK